MEGHECRVTASIGVAIDLWARVDGGDITGRARALAGAQWGPVNGAWPTTNRMRSVMDAARSFGVRALDRLAVLEARQPVTTLPQKRETL